MYSDAASPTRTTCAASRRPTPTAASSSPASSRPATPAGGRTCTSRSTSPSTTRRRTPTSCAPPSSRFPQDVCDDVYATDGYEASAVANLASVSLDSDGIFSDGYSLQMATVTGSVDDGYTVTLNIPV